MKQTFDKISTEYREKSLVQHKAAEKLFKLLKVKSTDDIIDIACGPGHITKYLSEIATGKIIGTDISGEMINQARNSFPELEFRQIAAEDLDYVKQFDLAFCNSALQWFTDPAKALRAINNSLKPGGTFAVGNPTGEWSPFFLRIISEVVKRKDIEPIFSHWQNPWFHLSTIGDYQLFFEQAGFKTVSIRIDHEKTEYSIEQANNIYLCGAANGFTNGKYFNIPIDEDYIQRFNRYVKNGIEREAKDGRVTVDFNRLFYVGEKNDSL